VRKLKRIEFCDTTEHPFLKDFRWVSLAIGFEDGDVYSWVLDNRHHDSETLDVFANIFAEIKESIEGKER
jgi:hypothetical protein